jgi:hypothetical protein
MQPIQWTELPTGALVGAGSLWPPNNAPHPTSRSHAPTRASHKVALTPRSKPLWLISTFAPRGMLDLS